MNNKEMMEILQAPFLPEEIEWRVGSTNKEKTKGLALAYVTNRAIQNRLDDVFGPFGWQNEFKEWKGNSQICGISVYDENKQIWITKWDGADDSQTEAVKGGLSDSMKRAAYQWGIGRYLYNLPQTWVELKNQRYLAEIPKLPQWALPKDYKPLTTEWHNENAKKMMDNILDKPQNVSKPQEDKKTTNPTAQDKTSTELACEGCGKKVTEKVAMFSTGKFGKKLCMDCQKGVK